MKETLATCSIAVAAIALLFTAWTRWKAANQAYYAHLSKVWYDLRKEESKNPRWIDPSRTSMYGLEPASELEAQGPTAYDAHAWSCWALAEDVFETYWRSWRRSKLTNEGGRKRFFQNELAQFEGSIRSVTELHWAWLQRPDHRARFADDFIEWIESEFLLARVAVLEGGSIAGRGVKAAHDIRAGQFVGFLSGALLPSRTEHTLQVGERLHLHLDAPLRFLNHAPTPGANAVVRGRSVFACARIPAGHEVTIDYSCTEDEFSLAPGGPKLGYGTLTAGERALRSQRLHVWLRDREERAAKAKGEKAMSGRLAGSMLGGLVATAALELWRRR